MTGSSSFYIFLGAALASCATAIQMLLTETELPNLMSLRLAVLPSYEREALEMRRSWRALLVTSAGLREESPGQSPGSAAAALFAAVEASACRDTIPSNTDDYR